MLAVATIGTASAITVTVEDVPDDVEAESEITAEVQLDELYSEFDAWALQGETDLENVTWTIEFLDGDTQIESYEIDGQEIRQDGIDRSLDEEPRQVRVSVTGEVPAIEEFDYENPETFTAIDLTQVRGEDGATRHIDTWDVHYYTTDSAEARQKIDEASAAVDEARADGVDVESAETTLDNAIGFYDAGEFDKAIENAERAQSEVEDARSSAERRSLLVYGGAGFAALLVLVGLGYALYQRREDDYDKLG